MWEGRYIYRYTALPAPTRKDQDSGIVSSLKGEHRQFELCRRLAQAGHQLRMTTLEDIIRIAVNAHDGMKDMAWNPTVVHMLAECLMGKTVAEQKAGGRALLITFSRDS